MGDTTGFIRRILVGKPLPNKEVSEHRLSNSAALAVFASDALSSVAYATEEMLLVLVLAGTVYLSLSLPLSLAIVILLFIVAYSYRQTVQAYPSGGGAYIVAKANLGIVPGLVAGAALLIDYVLTVAVSVAAGIAAITSAIPSLYPERVLLALVAVAIIMVGNLRGVRESGKIFAGPTYCFILAMAVLIVGGLFKYAFGSSITEAGVVTVPTEATHTLTAFLLIRAFSSGCTALTGVEAISNGVTAFKFPEASNASRVLRWLAMLLTCLFLGISFLSWLYGVIPNGHETVVSQLARAIYGYGPTYIFIQVSTCLILILAANTSFADFPRLSSLMAGDSYLPRQLQHRGDRLVFSNGILLLAFFAGVLLVLFRANTHRLIPLYAVGVFLSFTLSQVGMVIHHLRIKEPAWKSHMIINGIGALSTAVVLFAVLITKFTHGAWVVCVVIPILVFWFYAVFNHYTSASKQLEVDLASPPRKLKHTVIVPVSGIHRGVLTALEYARSLSKNVQAVTVAVDERAAEDLSLRWKQWSPDIKLVVLKSPYRELTEPLVEYIKNVDEQDPEDLITVVIPSFVPARWWHNFLHNQSSILLQAALRGMRNVVLTSVRHHFDR